MKLATFTHAGRTRIGLVDEREIVDLAAAAPALALAEGRRRGAHGGGRYRLPGEPSGAGATRHNGFHRLGGLP